MMGVKIINPGLDLENASKYFNGSLIQVYLDIPTKTYNTTQQTLNLCQLSSFGADV